MRQIKIAIIDDDFVFCETLKEILENYAPDTFTSSLEGLNALENNNYDILILDYYIDELTGANIVNRIRQHNNEIYIILLTGFSEKVPALESLKNLEIQDYCEKNARNFNNIIIRVESAVNSVLQIKSIRRTATFAERLKSLRESNNELQTDLANILGVSRQAIGSYESGRSEPSFDVLKMISKHYRVSIDFLLGNI